MNVLHVNTARVIWLVDSADLNPRGLNLYPALEAIRKRYGFQVFPESVDKMNEYAPEGIAFRLGSFENQGEPFTISKAVIFGDGLVVDTGFSTDLGEAFLEDALGFASETFGLTYRPEMVHTKIFTSEMVVHTDRDMSKLFAPLTRVQEKLNAWSGHKFHPGGFGLAIDTSETTAKPAPFRFEWEVNKPHRLGRFYTAAPLPTQKHIELLNELEGVL